MRLVLASLLLGLSACVPGGSLTGTLVDGLAGTPRTGDELRIIAKTADLSDPTCGAKESLVDAAGAFSLQALCADNTYALSLSDGSLMLEGAPTADGSAQVVGVNLTTWRAPAGPGIYVLSADALSMVRTFTDVKYETKVDDPEMKVAYPYMKPTGKVKTVNPGDFFIISGQAYLDRLKWRPLIADPGKRTFSDGSITDHIWVGMKFISDTDWEPVTATLDESKVKVVKAGDRVVHFIPSDALPAGRYALYGDKDKRMFIVDMGRSFAPAAPAAPVDPPASK
ncbi:MAG: hypothetical protein GXP62_07955 [Oligoflexia bacterium]|nr:hypothetical protein [Oligoflexia bacterium]